MWRTDTYWFDVAIVLGVAIVVATTAWAGHAWMYAPLGAIGIGVLVVHGSRLPRNGVNGWTGEPLRRYASSGIGLPH